jgi:IS30 family transposase
MPAERIGMRDAREIIRLKFSGSSTHEIALRLGMARSTVRETLQRAQAECPASAHYRSAGRSDPHAFIEILRIANAIGNAAAQSSAMNQNARGPNAP